MVCREFIGLDLVKACRNETKWKKLGGIKKELRMGVKSTVYLTASGTRAPTLCCSSLLATVVPFLIVPSINDELLTL